MVCLPKIRGDVFTTAAVDNIDHTPSSSTSEEFFNGTGKSLLQHLAFAGQGVDRSIVSVGGAAGQKTVGHLPSHCTDVTPIVCSITKAPEESDTWIRRR